MKTYFTGDLAFVNKVITVYTELKMLESVMFYNCDYDLRIAKLTFYNGMIWEFWRKTEKSA